MGFLGIIEDKKLSHVPATVILSEEQHITNEATLGLKRGTGKNADIVLIPQPYVTVIVAFSPHNIRSPFEKSFCRHSSHLTSLQIRRPERPVELVYDEKMGHHEYRRLRFRPLRCGAGASSIASLSSHRDGLRQDNRRHHSDLGLHASRHRWRRTNC